MKIKIFNRKIVVQGDSHYVYIPKVYFNNKQLSIDEIYDVVIIPQKKKQEKVIE